MESNIIISVVFFVFIVMFMGVLFYSKINPYLKDSSSQNMVLVKGVATNAEVIMALQTSTWTGNKPIYKLIFRFKTAKGEVMESSLMRALTFKEIEEYKEGNQVVIKYMPDDPHKICILEKS